VAALLNHNRTNWGAAMRHLVLLATSAFVLSTVSVHAQPSLRLEMEIIGSFPGFQVTLPSAINDHGIVVGAVFGENTPQKAFVWSRNGGFQVIAENSAVAHDINNRGEVVGDLAGGGGTTGQVGFIWTESGGLEILGESFLPFAINDNGDMAGICLPAFFACVRVNGVETRIPTDDCCDSLALGINNQGDVVGLAPHSEDPEGLRGFFFSRRGVFKWLSDDDEQRLSPRDINDTGVVVGRWQEGDTPFAAFWRDARRTRASFPSEAYAINNAGNAVGVRIAEDGVGTTPILWDTSQQAIPLKTPVPFGTVATDISNSGTIVGHFSPSPGERRIVLWRLLPPLQIESPNTPSRWGLNTRQRLAWTYHGDAPQLQIDISRDGGALWDSLAVVPRRSGGSQNFYWTVTGPVTANARLRVTAIGDDDATDINNANIRIADAGIEFIHPHRRTVAQVGLTQTIVFKHNLGAGKQIAIDVSADRGGTWRTIADTRTKGSTTSSHSWTVDLAPMARAQVRVRALDGSAASEISETFAVRVQNLEITGGGIVGQMWVDPWFGGMAIEGQNVRASGISIPGAPCYLLAGGCREGDTIDFSRLDGWSHQSNLLQELVLDGRTIADGAVGLSFRVAPVVIRQGGVTAPFTMTGTISEFASDGQTEILRATLYCRGTMDVRFEPFVAPDGRTELFTRTISYNCEPAALTITKTLP
jgi:uncharacterized membrane protein